ncbi:MAG: hypothetical protein JGK24_15030 [Microcoleus sp. PH2017_29_MFU_D_A]|jgi:hypothetical protein|uniref:hypothetical protein n=1 Tax=unclassified Microcoleus TaxID=2642155 RepID=UPI001DA3A13E|nr:MULTISPECIES: hypothetical protein [unclassified Microcoleus]MCC3419823.1 hypothetical protein [Microcoleus sp. PH2017_07_MST_O_A]MCC3442434.1 hypothetical protein [Microcoleus sp. PH2017_03_ELD_O_A]MCC3502327.1 hypothetical protein [Microcoleus sp. PH2017_19_SFW_U_A]MCC3508934.1 hypothetical protein [Microcoleus sp. PH2017_17_BER_D_A]MCC3411855.1 hypothetical protein [Microcoleus sp. PH2017_02_FOX_O_A]
MPVPQKMIFLVEQASCLFLKGLSTLVQDLRCNGFNENRFEGKWNKEQERRKKKSFEITLLVATLPGFELKS